VTRPDAAAAVIAGGKARRFGGRDKSRLVVHGRAIIVRQIEVLRRVAASIVIIANEPERFADLGLPVQADLIPGAGAMGGIYTALEIAPADRVIVVGCDLPFLDPDVLDHLVELADGGDGAWVRSPRGVEPLIACYRRSARSVLRREIEAGRLALHELESVLRMQALEGRALEAFGPADRLTTNINSPDDYRRVQ
jgi:molybdopterin-guanine dinucleotide biosynthesis protein A